MGPTFSRRLGWRTDENSLARAEARVRATGAAVLDLTSSNPTDVGLPDVADDLGRAFARAEIARYAPAPCGSPAARRCVSALYASKGTSVDPERIILTASSSESYSFLFKLLADPGDIVLVPEPSYPLFDYLAALEGVEARRYRLVYEGLWHLDRHSVEAALADLPASPTGARGPRVAAVVVVSPNNPTGTVLRRDDLAWLDRRCADVGAALIADEVFSDFVDPAPPDWVRCAAAQPTAALTFSLGGLSKGCGLPQLKLGWIAIGGPSDAAADALARLELIADTYLSVGTPVQAALPDLLALGARRRDALVGRLAENRGCLARAIGADSPLATLRSDGGWSAIIRVPAVRTDEEWALALLEQHGVLVQPGYFFDLPAGAHLVVSLLPAPSTFAAGIARLVSFVDDTLGRQSSAESTADHRSTPSQAPSR